MPGSKHDRNGICGDYIRLIQDTQGALGHDDRDGAKEIDPETPPDLVQRMNALHAYVRLPGKFAPSFPPATPG